MICSYTNKQTQYQLNFIKETNLFLVRIHIWYQFMALTGCPSIFFKADCVHTHIQSTNSLFAKGTRSGSVDSKPVPPNYHEMGITVLYIFLWSRHAFTRILCMHSTYQFR